MLLGLCIGLVCHSGHDNNERSVQGTRLAALFDALEKNQELQRHLRGVMDKVRGSSGCVA